MKPAVALAVAAIGLAGCYTSREEIAYPSIEEVKAKRDAATLAWLKCDTPLLIKLDDGRSDPQTIAMGARSGCPDQFKAMVFAYLPVEGNISDMFPIIERSLDERSVRVILDRRTRQNRS